MNHPDDYLFWAVSALLLAFTGWHVSGLLAMLAVYS